MIRAATVEDAAAIAAIYAHHVLHGTGTFDEEPPPAAAFAARIAEVAARGWPWLVAEADGTVIGYAYATQFRDRPAYRLTCENSVYVRAGDAGRGIGSALLVALIVAAGASGFRRMVAVIGDSANAASIGLHARHGFAQAGVLHAVGVKFGRVLDVVMMERDIAADRRVE